MPNKKRHAKLPEIKLLTFSGNSNEWETFWSSFHNIVNSRDDLEQSAKLTYLLQSLGGEPREMIKRLSRTDGNYLIVINSLHDRYADPIKQTEVLLQNFFNLPSPCHNAKELSKFLTEYRKVRDQMRHVEDSDASALTIRPVLLRKLSYQTYSEISDHVKNHNFSLQEMDSNLQYIIGKLEHAYPIMGDKTNVKIVGTHSHSNQGGNFKCLFCAGDHKSADCNKYKSVQTRKDCVIAQRLCFNCLIPGHSSKHCRSKKMYSICHLHHHTSLCNQSSSSGDTSQPSKSNQSSNASHGSQQQQQQQQQQHPHTQVQNHQQPVVTQHKSNTHKQHAPSSSASTTTSARVTNINVSNFSHNVLPTATLNVSHCHARTITRAFFNTGSQRNFVSPELVCKLNLPVIEQVPVHLSTFGNDTALHFLDLVKVQVGRCCIPIKLLVHDSASMRYLNCPRIYNITQTLEKQGHQLTDRNITSDSLTGIELLIGIDYFAQFITRQKRASGISLFVTRRGGVGVGG